MEGVTFSLKQVVDLMKSFTPCEKVYTSGGGSASALWRQMQADVFDLPVYTMSAPEASQMRKQWPQLSWPFTV